MLDKYIVLKLQQRWVIDILIQRRLMGSNLELEKA